MSSKPIVLTTIRTLYVKPRFVCLPVPRFVSTLPYFFPKFNLFLKKLLFPSNRKHTLRASTMGWVFCFAEIWKGVLSRVCTCPKTPTGTGSGSQTRQAANFTPPNRQPTTHATTLFFSALKHEIIQNTYFVQLYICVASLRAEVITKRPNKRTKRKKEHDGNRREGRGRQRGKRYIVYICLEYINTSPY